MPRTTAAMRERRKTTRTEWLTRTKPSHTIGGNRLTEAHVKASTITAVPQHRDHGAYRCREDHNDRARPLLHGRLVQNRRGSRRHCDHGLDGAGTGARNHDHVGCDDVLLAAEW